VKLKIGFCRTFSDAKQLAAESECHAVLVGEDHSFEPVNHLLHLLNDALQQGRQQIPQRETPATHDSFHFFHSENVFLNENFFSNITSFLDRLASKPCNLLFISDFDHTITTFSSEQCHDLIGNVSEYSEEFRSKYQEFMVEYGPSNVYGEFHTLCHDLVTKESGLTRDMFHKSLSLSNIPKVRPGLKQFIELLNELSLPLLISSAGIKDIIVSTLHMQDIDISQGESLVNIYANYLQFDSSGKLTAILPLDPIHSQSKHLASERLDEFFYTPMIAPPSAPIIPNGTLGPNLQSTADSHSDPTGSCSMVPSKRMQWGVALLLGDSPGDFTVLQDHPEVLTMKVGFARDEAAAAALMEQAGCHVVLVGINHSWDPVNRLLDVFLDAQGRGGKE
jgi:2-hydroxy-3-keto-5-methylthiopentenyl-1-phosphate phosphatase